MPPKRPFDDGGKGGGGGGGGGGGSGKGPSKKQFRAHQIRDARQIHTQQQQRPASISTAMAATAGAVQKQGASSSTTTTMSGMYAGAGTGSGSSSSMAPLMPQLDVEQFVNARKFEIQAMQTAMKNARDAATTRAWQLLPRHARRRAASHNVTRLPRRLRSKALSELVSSNTAPKTRAATRARQATHPRTAARARSDELRGRAVREGKAWLETHLWHAKRFRMDDNPKGLWGYRLAITPHQKAHRASYRSATRAVALHDASYTPCFRLTSTVSDSDIAATTDDGTAALARVLRLCCAEGWSARWTSGARECSTMFLGGDGCRALAPVRVLWLPLSSTTELADGSQGSVSSGIETSGPKGKGKGKGKEKEGNHEDPMDIDAFPNETGSTAQSSDRKGKRKNKGKSESTRAGRGQVLREVILRVHLAAADAVYEVLRAKVTGPGVSGIVKDGAGSSVAEAGESGATQTRVQVKLTRLSSVPSAGTSVGGAQAGKASKNGRAMAAAKSKPNRERNAQRPDEGFNAFELTGPHAGRTLGMLRLTPGNSKVKKMAFMELTQNATPASVPHGFVLALEVYDPRLNFPPKNAKVTSNAEEDLASARAFAHQPSPELASSMFFTHGKELPKFSKGEIDSRRAKLLVPGSHLAPSSQDDRVPILIIQHSPQSASTSANASSSGPSASSLPAQPQHGYTLLVPRGWGNAFWLSLVSTGARVLGQVEVRHAALESGLPSFPHDWVGTTSWASVSRIEERKKRKEWEARPPAKRLNWEALDTKWPFGGTEMWKHIVCNVLARWEGHVRAEQEQQRDCDSDVRSWISQALQAVSGADFSTVVQTDEGGKRTQVDKAATTPLNLDPWLCFLGSSPSSPGALEPLIAALAAHEPLQTLSSRFHQFSRSTSKSRLQATETQPLPSTSPMPTLTFSPSPSPSPITGLQNLSSAFVSVRVTACRKGAPRELGIIYLLTETETLAWTEALLGEDEGTELEERDTKLEELESIKRPHDDAIGYITSGDYALSQGCGFAIGAISLVSWLELLRRERERGLESEKKSEQSSHAPPPRSRSRRRNEPNVQHLVAVRNRDGIVCRAASLALAPLV